MHISDGVLSLPAMVGGYTVALSITAATVKKLKIEDMPKISVITAVFFVASLIHIPLGPTSVHLILNGLVGVVLGMASFISIFIGLTLQCLLFQHGGITSLGWNACMMGIPALLSYAVFQTRRSKVSGFLFKDSIGSSITCFFSTFIITFSIILCSASPTVLLANKISSPVTITKFMGGEASFRSQAIGEGFKAAEVDSVLKRGVRSVFSDKDDIKTINGFARNASFYKILSWSSIIGVLFGIFFTVAGKNTKDTPEIDQNWNILLKIAYRLNHISGEYVFGFAGGAIGVIGSGILLALGLSISGEDFIPVAKVALFAHVFVMVFEGILVGFTVTFLKKIKPEIIGE